MKDDRDSPRRTLSSSLLRRASIIPVDPTAAPAPHRFSLLRERASEETIFVQEICDAEGRRWSLRVPASGLPQDMVHMLEELEKLAVELGQALPRIVVTCSAESLSLKRMERNLNVAVSSSELLRPPPAPAGCDAGTGRSLAKEKCRLVESEQASKEPSSVAVSSASEQSLTCIYLPEVSHFRLPSSFNSQRSHRPACTRVPIGQLKVSRPTTRRRLPQQTSTRDPMPASARLLLSTQGTPNDERHRQTASVPPGQDRNRAWGCCRRRSRTGFLPFGPASEIETPHPSGQIKVGVADLEGQLLQGFDSDGGGGGGESCG